MKPKHLALGFLFFLAIWGWLRAGDVGVSWDEPYQRAYGEVVYAYLMDGDMGLHTDSERLYGPVVPFALTLAEKAMGTVSDRDAYRLRHRLTWFLFLGGAWVFFLLASDLFGNRHLGLLAMVSLVLSPSLSSHGFFNTKDIPFMVGCIVSVYVAVRAFGGASHKKSEGLKGASLQKSGGLGGASPQKTFLARLCRARKIRLKGLRPFDPVQNCRRQAPDATMHAGLGGASLQKSGGLGGASPQKKQLAKAWPVIATAIAAGMTTDIRILGVLFLPILGLLWGRHSWKKALLFFMSYLGTVYLFWPSLWASPLSVFWESLCAMGHYPWGGTVMYLGFFEEARHLPWHYLFGYIGVTTPLLYLLGAVLCLIRFRRVVTDLPDRVLWVGLLWFFLPLGLILGNGAVLYDSWRHVFFVYPGFVLLSTYGLALLYQAYLKNTQKGRVFGVACLALAWIPLGWFMLREAPLSYVYFNALAGQRETLHSRFETDYWGLSYREGLEWVAAYEKRPWVKVWMPHYPGEQSLDLLTAAEQKKLRWVADPSEADYLITTFRWITALPSQEPLYEKRVGGISILRVYGLK